MYILKYICIYLKLFACVRTYCHCVAYQIIPEFHVYFLLSKTRIIFPFSAGG